MVSYVVTGANRGIGLAFVQALHVSFAPHSSRPWVRTDDERTFRRNATHGTRSLPLSAIQTRLTS